MTTIPLVFSPEQLTQYRRYTAKDQAQLTLPAEGPAGPAPIQPNQEGEGRTNTRAARGLSVVAFDLKYGVAIEKARAAAKVARKTSRSSTSKKPKTKLTPIPLGQVLSDDLGASQFFLETRIDPNMIPYPDRASMAQYMASHSPKMAALADILNRWCLIENEKVLILNSWPAVQRYALPFLTLVNSSLTLVYKPLLILS